MLKTGKKQHIAGIIMLSLTAIFWGAGFVINDNLLNTSFNNTPNLINTIRFGVASVLLGIIFARKLKFTRKTLLYAGVGATLLFLGFTLQLWGLQRSVPSHNGFFTAAYVVFVPFIAWIFRKKRPSWITFFGVGIAFLGLAILNLNTDKGVSVSDTAAGDLLTLVGAVMFAAQIALTDYAYSKREIDYANMTFWQVLFAAILFTLYSVIFESPHYHTVTFNPSFIWQFAIISIGGTTFAYLSQSYAQNNLPPSETSIILACESPIGMMLSVIIGIEAFTWNTAVGGALVIADVIMMEVIGSLMEKREKAKTEQNKEQDGGKLEEQNSELNDEPNNEHDNEHNDE